MRCYLELATLKQFHLKASSKQWVAMRCYAAAERCSLICLPPSQMHLQARRSARLVARPTVVPVGILESMPGGDLPKLHSETLQQNGPQGNFPLRSAIGMVFVMLESTIFDFRTAQPGRFHCGGRLQIDNRLGSLPGIIANPLEIVRSEANLTTTPLEPMWRAWICRSYWQDTVGTWRCPVAVAHLHEMTWPHCNISSASIPPKLVKLIVFLPRAALVPVLLSLGILRICNFLPSRPADLQGPPHPAAIRRPNAGPSRPPGA